MNRVSSIRHRKELQVAMNLTMIYSRPGTDMNLNLKVLSEKIQTLSAEQIREVENFVDFLRLRGEGELTRSVKAMSAPAFAAVWSNPEDDVYDAL